MTPVVVPPADRKVGFYQTFADGIKSYADTVLEALSGFRGKARSLLPFIDAPDEDPGNTPLVIPNLDLGAINLPIGPSPAAAPAGAGASSRVTQTFGQGAIQINVPGGNAREIAGALEQAVRDHWRASAEQMDSRQIA